MTCWGPSFWHNVVKWNCTPRCSHKICSCTQNCCWTHHMPQSITHYKNKQTAHSSLDWWSWEGIKPGTERNGTEVIAAQCGTWTPDMLWENCQANESWSRVLYLPRRWDKHPTDRISTWNLRLHGVADPSLTSEWSAMSLPSLSYSWFSRGE